MQERKKPEADSQKLGGICLRKGKGMHIDIRTKKGPPKGNRSVSSKKKKRRLKKARAGPN